MVTTDSTLYLRGSAVLSCLRSTGEAWQLSDLTNGETQIADGILSFERIHAEVVKWQTHHLEGVAPKGMGVQVPPSAPK